jgi:hypothetical protein
MVQVTRVSNENTQITDIFPDLHAWRLIPGLDFDKLVSFRQYMCGLSQTLCCLQSLLKCSPFNL